MAYFSALSVSLQEQREALSSPRSTQENDYPSSVEQLCWRLEDLKDRLKELMCRKDLRRPGRGEEDSNWEAVYREWPEYWVTGRQDAFWILPRDLDTVPDVLRAIASTQKRLLFYGRDADAEARRRRTLPLEGQLSLPIAS